MISSRDVEGRRGLQLDVPGGRLRHRALRKHLANAVPRGRLAQHGLEVLGEPGAGVEQQALDFGEAVPDGEVERGPSPAALVDQLRVRLDQGPRLFGVAEDDRGPEVDGRTCLDQDPDDAAAVRPVAVRFVPALIGGPHERGPSVAVGGVDAGPPIQQQRRDIPVAVVGGLVQRSSLSPVAERLPLVDPGRVAVELGGQPLPVVEHDEVDEVEAPPAAISRSRQSR